MRLQFFSETFLIVSENISVSIVSDDQDTSFDKIRITRVIEMMNLRDNEIVWSLEI